MAFHQYGVVYRNAVMSHLTPARLASLRAIGISLFAAAFLSAALLCTPHAVAQDNQATKANLGIIGGKTVSAGEYTFVVALRDKRDDRIFCTGQIVGDFWVLTAKHCIDGKIRPANAPFVVRTGRNMKEGKSIAVAAKNIFPNPALDVALLKLTTKITSASVSKIPIRVEEPPPLQSEFVAVGWGLMRATDIQGATVLQKLDSLEVTTCQIKYHICGKFPESGARTANGDSGGPAVYEQSGSLESFGVLSGINRKTPDRVDYVSSDAFYLWAIDTMQSH
ncbi:serine-type enodpeptidase, putative [Ricinus communis]|uniref:Serine-type enodpeptidase, putative n=1 Tax=Ricinus communis TaxID=3988 RepID=B9TEG9_RICCO|nr:serine-type enodpeptidase, putative [Ricinus communis]